LAVIAGLALPAAGQTVISARSGVIHFFEGSVYLNDQPLESQPGRFASMAPGAELRTAQGSAEVLLTPGFFLRIGERSAIRMVADDLADTRAELLAGSAIVEADEPNPGTSVTLIYKQWKVHFVEKGSYRVDSEPPRLWVNQGKAEVSTEGAATPVSVGRGMDLPFAAVLVPEELNQEPVDKLSDWSEGRSESISADNKIASQISDDPASMDSSNLPPDALTYFPLVGPSGFVPALSSPYSSLVPYQPGFNSIYLPGYTYRPYVLAVPMGGYGRIPMAGYGRFPYSPPRIGGLPGVGTRSPGFAAPRIPLPHPAPVLPVPHPMPHIGVHGGHR